MGAYHGRHSIECFQHRKPVMQKWRGMGDGGLLTDPFFVYGPHNEGSVKLKLLRMVGNLS
jgi:aldehyde dehydrogenase (NAD+)